MLRSRTFIKYFILIIFLKTPLIDVHYEVFNVLFYYLFSIGRQGQLLNQRNRIRLYIFCIFKQILTTNLLYGYVQLGVHRVIIDL